jgi:hypothetical protein
VSGLPIIIPDTHPKNMVFVFNATGSVDELRIVHGECITEIASLSTSKKYKRFGLDWIATNRSVLC